MSPCPDLSKLDSLSIDDREAHLSQCSSCRMLMSLRNGGDEEFSEECESTEMLLAVAADSELNALDQRRLSRHLEGCERCTGLAGALLLADGGAPQPALSSSNTWDHPRRYDNSMQPANDQRSLVFLAFGVLTAAAAIFLIVRGLGGEDKEEARALVADHDSKSGRSVDDSDISNNSTAGASRPAPEMPLAPARAVAELLAESTEAIQAKNFAVGLSLCSAALEQEPANQKAHLNCAIAACKTGDAPSSRFHIAGISDEEQANGVTKICMDLGVPLDGTEAMLAGDLFSQARKKVEQEDYLSAQALCTKSLTLEPGYDSAIGLCAEIACHLGQAERAQSHLENISSVPRRQMAAEKCDKLKVALRGGKSNSPTNRAPSGSSYRSVMGAFGNKDYAMALNMAEEALKASPYDARMLTLASISACVLKKSQDATKYQQRVRNSNMRPALKKICRRLNTRASAKDDPDESNRYYQYLVKEGSVPPSRAYVEEAHQKKLALASNETGDTDRVKQGSGNAVPKPPPTPPDPDISTAELVEQAEKALMGTQYGKGSKLCAQVLDREPENQRALTACVIAACNLRQSSKAKKYIRRIKSSQRRQGLKQICTRIGNAGFRSEEPAPPIISTSDLLKQAQNALKNTQYGKGAKLCSQVLEREPGNQQALTACAIATCNLRKASSAKRYIRRIKSSQRRQGLKQICSRLGNSGFTTD